MTKDDKVKDKSDDIICGFKVSDNITFVKDIDYVPYFRKDIIIDIRNIDEYTLIIQYDDDKKVELKIGKIDVDKLVSKLEDFLNKIRDF